MDVIFTNAFMDDNIVKISKEIKEIVEDILKSGSVPHNDELKLSIFESSVNELMKYMPKEILTYQIHTMSFVNRLSLTNAYIEEDIRKDLKNMSIDLYPFVDYYTLVGIYSEGLINKVKVKLEENMSVDEIPMSTDIMLLRGYFCASCNFIEKELIKRLVKKGIIYHHLYSKDKLDAKGICIRIEKELLYRVIEIGKGKEDLPISITSDPVNGVYLLTVRDKYGWLDITIPPNGDILVYINSGEVYEDMEYGDAFHYSILIENNKELFNNLIDLTIGKINEFNLEFKDKSLKTKISV